MIIYFRVCMYFTDQLRLKETNGNINSDQNSRFMGYAFTRNCCNLLS